jgi:hypothetical protein
MKATAKPTGTDWQRVKREAATDAPIDDQTGLYDPNDQAATAEGYTVATRYKSMYRSL